jgi:para-nitrobenzyl esterase
VFVSVTHRLNAFGFLYLDSIAGADYRGSGNAGLLGLVAALEWVRDNIAAFGGDPGNVTIAGQSGGARQVSLLLIMEQAKGLFHRAACESGFAFSLKAPADAERYAGRLIAEVGGSDATALVSASMQDLLDAQERIAVKDREQAPLSTGPVLDGVVFSQPPGQIWDSGRGSAVPLLTGWTLDETALFSGQDIDADIPVPAMLRPERPQERAGGADSPVDAGLGAISFWTGGRDATGVIAARRALFPAELDAVLARRLASEIQYRRPAERAALAREAAGSATYVYRIEWQSPVLSPLGVPHCAGIAPFFANEQLVAFTRDNTEARALAETMSSALATFMRTGDPSTDMLQWPPYQAEDRAVMILDRQPRLCYDPEPAVRLALDELSPPWRL